MLSVYSREIEILHQIAIAPIPPHGEKSGYLRNWNTRLVTPLRQRISLPTFEGIRGLYLTRCLTKECYTSQSIDRVHPRHEVFLPPTLLLLLSFSKSGVGEKE